MKKIEREDWFTAGLGILNTGGFLKITIENLCEVLKVTKGSFYHHFKNVDGYIDAFMSYWVEKNTKALIEIADQEEPGGNQRAVAQVALPPVRHILQPDGALH